MSDAGTAIDSVAGDSPVASHIDTSRADVATPGFITINEVRVLSGLSRGAALPIDAPLYIGADPDCEIYLMDPGVADRHFLVDVGADGLVRVLDLTLPAAKPVEQPESRPFHAGDVELIWCRSDRSWERSSADTAEEPLAGNNGSRPTSLRRAPTQRRKLLWIGASAATVFTLVLLGWMSIAGSSRQANVKAALPARAQALDKPSHAAVVDTQSKLQEALRANALSQLSVEVRDDKLVITGDIRTGQQQQLETLVQSWKREHPSIRLVLKLTDPAAPTLPFEIVALVGGSTPSVLASTGESLYMGSESNGYRLVLLSGACLTFEQIDTHQRLKQCLDPSSPQR